MPLAASAPATYVPVPRYHDNADFCRFEYPAPPDVGMTKNYSYEIQSTPPNQLIWAEEFDAGILNTSGTCAYSRIKWFEITMVLNAPPTIGCSVRVRVNHGPTDGPNNTRQFTTFEMYSPHYRLTNAENTITMRVPVHDPFGYRVIGPSGRPVVAYVAAYMETIATDVLPIANKVRLVITTKVELALADRIHDHPPARAHSTMADGMHAHRLRPAIGHENVGHAHASTYRVIERQLPEQEDGIPAAQAYDYRDETGLSSHDSWDQVFSARDIRLRLSASTTATGHFATDPREVASYASGASTVVDMTPAAVAIQMHHRMRWRTIKLTWALTASALNNVTIQFGVAHRRLPGQSVTEMDTKTIMLSGMGTETTTVNWGYESSTIMTLAHEIRDSWYAVTTPTTPCPVVYYMATPSVTTGSYSLECYVEFEGMELYELNGYTPRTTAMTPYTVATAHSAPDQPHPGRKAVRQRPRQTHGFFDVGTRFSPALTIDGQSITIPKGNVTFFHWLLTGPHNTGGGDEYMPLVQADATGGSINISACWAPLLTMFGDINLDLVFCVTPATPAAAFNMDTWASVSTTSYEIETISPSITRVNMAHDALTFRIYNDGTYNNTGGDLQTTLPKRVTYLTLPQAWDTYNLDVRIGPTFHARSLFNGIHAVVNVPADQKEAKTGIPVAKKPAAEPRRPQLQ